MKNRAQSRKDAEDMQLFRWREISIGNPLLLRRFAC